MPQPSRHITARLTVRKGSQDQWQESNPVLLEGELAWEKDARRLKVGDGETPWNELPYYLVGDSEAPSSLIHNGDILPSYINSVSSAIEYFGAKFQIYDNFGVNEFISGLTGEEAKYTLTISAGSGGTANANGERLFALNGVANISAIPFPGYQFDYWIGDGIADSSSATTTKIVTGDEYIRANFKLIT